jgi:hypothetical protein
MEVASFVLRLAPPEHRTVKVVVLGERRPSGGGQLYEVRTCEHYLQLMVETYIGGAQVAHAERSATASQAERKETATPRVEHDSSFRMALPRLARRAR